MLRRKVQTTPSVLEMRRELGKVTCKSWVTTQNDTFGIGLRFNDIGRFVEVDWRAVSA